MFRPVPLRLAFRAPLALLSLALPATAFANAAEPYEAPSDRTSYARALECMTQAIYYEARSEPEAGQRAVAQVVLNRVRSPLYPNSVCGVVFQGSHRRTGCQFSFTCDRGLRPPSEGAAWARAERYAAEALRGYVFRPVGLSLNYHTTAIRPYWAPSLIRHAVIGAHIFYRQPGHTRLAAFTQAPAAMEPAPGTSVAPIARATRTARASTSRLPSARSFGAPARIEAARVERPIYERAVVQRPPGFGSGRRASAPRRGQGVATQAQPRPASGPRTTIQNGVRVSRGS